MAVGVVDLLELVEVEEHEGQRAVVPRGARPLALDLFLEGAVVAEAGEPVEQRLGARLVIGALERAQASAQPFGRLEHAVGQPDGEQAKAGRERDDDQGRQHERRALAPRLAVDDRCRDRDRDREHGDERKEQAQPDQAEVGRIRP